MAHSFEDGLIIFLVVEDDGVFHQILLEPIVQIPRQVGLIIEVNANAGAEILEGS